MEATILDIANLVGVSKKTVSLALNNKPGVNEETRRIIQKTAKDLNYIPNFIAKSLFLKRTKTIGLVISNLWNIYFNEIIRGVEDNSKKKSYNILLGISNEDSDLEYTTIKMLMEKRIDGLLIFPVQKNNKYIKLIEDSNIPVVLLNRRNALLDSSYVINNNAQGGFIAIDYFIKKGYKDICCIFPDNQPFSVKERIKGCKEALEKNNISSNNLKILKCEKDLSSCYNITKEKVNYKGKRIGLFVWNDQMTISVYKAIVDKGLKVPSEVGIIGYEDFEFSKYFPIPLTTVKNPGYEIGMKATEILIKKIKKKELFETDRVVLEPCLVIRESA